MWVGAAAACAAALLASATAAIAQAPLTEAEAARLAVAGPEWDAAAAARRRAIEARAAATGLRPNPELEVAHEGGEGFGGDGAEDSARLTYPLDLTGARRAQRQAGRVRAEMELAEAEQRLVERSAEARRLFHKVTSLSRREAVLGRRIELLQTATDITLRRFKEGDASELELRRVELEAGAARAERDRVVSQRAAAWASLSALIGVAAAPPSASPPSATPLPPLDDLLRLMEQSATMRRARAETALAEAEVQAIRRESRFADTAVFGGLRSVEDPMGRTTGVLVGGRVGLPVLGGGRARLQAELAEATAARADERLLLEQRRRSVVAAHASAVRLNEGVRQAAEAVALHDRVFRPARAAWEGGEIELTELLNIYRTATDAELAALELSEEAAEARVEMDALVGKIEP
ncbi:MAG TPA: TolC family protein [Caulobacteraceae bacterium]|jgi:cobalt-zinc-cadmium efflux system outer membrane protein